MRVDCERLVSKNIAIKLYKRGIISLGKMSEMLDISKKEAMSLLNSLNIVWIDEDYEVIEEEASRWL